MAVVALDPKKRRTYRGEEKWFPVLKELGPSGLRAAFIAAGISPQVAGNLVWFIEDQQTLERTLSQSTRNNYRGALAALDPAQFGSSGTRAIPGQFNSDTVAA